MPPPAAPVDKTAQFQWLRTGDEGLTQMLQEIKQAKISIRIETYIVHAGPLAEEYREALVEACRRGVKVWIMVDALGSISLPTAFWDPFVQAGGHFAWFNPITHRRWSYRDHRKLMVLDERVAFVGGFNIADEYKGDGVSFGWRDLGMRVTGSPVPLLARSFDKFFARAPRVLRLDAKGKDCTGSPRRVFLCKRIIRIIRQPRIRDPFHARVLRQKFRDGLGVFDVAFHTHRKRLQTLNQEKGIER